MRHRPCRVLPLPEEAHHEANLVHRLKQLRRRVRDVKDALGVGSRDGREKRVVQALRSADDEMGERLGAIDIEEELDVVPSRYSRMVESGVVDQ